MVLESLSRRLSRVFNRRYCWAAALYSGAASGGRRHRHSGLCRTSSSASEPYLCRNTRSVRSPVGVPGSVACSVPEGHSVRWGGFCSWKEKHVTLFLLQYYRKNMANATTFPAATTPALIEFSQLESWLASSGALQLPLHQIELQQQAKGREVQRLLLQAHLQHRGNGDVGPALQLEQPDGEVSYSRRRLSTRSLTTVFGTVELTRMGYSRAEVPSIFPLDKALALPARRSEEHTSE